MVKPLDTIKSPFLYTDKQLPSVPSRANRPCLGNINLFKENRGKVHSACFQAGLNDAPQTSNIFVAPSIPHPSHESETVKETQGKVKKSEKGMLKRFLALFRKKKKEPLHVEPKRNSSFLSRLLRALKFKKTEKNIPLVPVKSLSSKENISVESYHRLVKELISSLSTMPAITDPASTTASVFRASAVETVLTAFEKKFYANQNVKLPPEIASDINNMAGAVKRIVFRDMPVERFRALKLDSAFLTERPEEEIFLDLRKKINTLPIPEKEFLKDLIFVIDLAYKKSWQHRLDAKVETMVISVPTIARFFNSNLQMDPNPINPIELATVEVQKLIPFLIRNQKALFV